MSLKDIIGSAAADLYRTNNKVYSFIIFNSFLEFDARCRNIFWNKTEKISNYSY